MKMKRQGFLNTLMIPGLLLTTRCAVRSAIQMKLMTITKWMMKMTEQEAIKYQAELAKHYNLSFWYGTSCHKCYSVYPRFMTMGAAQGKCYYQCEVCGKRTDNYDMPWQAMEAWNAGKFLNSTVQLRLF